MRLDVSLDSGRRETLASYAGRARPRACERRAASGQVPAEPSVVMYVPALVFEYSRGTGVSCCAVWFLV